MSFDPKITATVRAQLDHGYEHAKGTGEVFVDIAADAVQTGEPDSVAWSRIVMSAEGGNVLLDQGKQMKIIRCAMAYLALEVAKLRQRNG